MINDGAIDKNANAGTSYKGATFKYPEKFTDKSLNQNIMIWEYIPTV